MDAEPTYTVFIRLPFPRDEFIDPPPVNWDTSMDELLWNVLSGVSKTNIDWQELAERFQVTVDFILQQATYLTDRHASQIRAQMRKATAAKGSSAPSPIPGSDSAAAEAMRRTGSGGGGAARAPSSLSVRRDSPLPKPDASLPGTPGKLSFGRPAPSRNPSSHTAASTPRAPASPRPDKGAAAAALPQRTRLSSLPMTAAAARDSDPPSSPGPASSQDSSSSDSSSSSPTQSRIIRRPARFQQQDAGGSFADDDDDDDDAEPAFLPLKLQPPPPPPGAGSKDLGATLKGDLSRGREHRSQTSDSSASSAAPEGSKSAAGGGRRPGPLSPRRTAELAGRSSGGKGKGYSREGSEGSPSMGSSFSDLDDASVTQSALEEALASKMNDGTIGSRMSNFSQAFRSRYMQKPSQS